jgi:peptidoglycan/LPS O-acetylase OafA/YrhL
MHYRPDIDGLRAISVVIVVLFHLGLSWLPGGFVGVDVFFVISGYLITGILVRDIEVGSFSLVSFYERRIKRIVPALLVMLAIVFGLGWLFLMPGDYDTMARSALYTVISFSNIFFALNTGYFDAASGTMPLLHTWSLAVEEQFYFVWPILLFITAKLCRNNRASIAVVCAVIAMCGFAWSVHLVGNAPKLAFYGTDARAWELAVGALIAAVPPTVWPRSRVVASLARAAGLSLIFYAALHLTEASAFPGINALLPVVGAALLLMPLPADSLVVRGLSLRPVVFLGQISYSLYLWHWPIIVFFRHYNLAVAPTLVQSLLLVGVMLPAAWLSWQFVEQPIRRSKLRPIFIFGVGAASASAIGALGSFVIIAAGYPQRISDDAKAMRSLAVMWEWPSMTWTPIPDLQRYYFEFGSPWTESSRRALLWGDSHAQHLAPLLEPFAKRAGTSVLLYAGCPAVIDNRIIKRYGGEQIPPSYSRDCAESRARGIEFLQRHPEISLVILTAAWTSLLDVFYNNDPQERSSEIGGALLEAGLNALIPLISANGRRIVLVADVPQWNRDPIPCAIANNSGLVLRRACSTSEGSLSRSLFSSISGPAYQAIAAATRWQNVSAYFLGSELCRNEYCMTRLNGEFLYRDAGHLRRNLSERTRVELAKMLKLDEVFRPDPGAEYASAGK